MFIQGSGYHHNDRFRRFPIDRRAKPHFYGPQKGEIGEKSPREGGGGGPGGPKGPFPCVYISDQLTCLESESMGFLMGEK